MDHLKLLRELEEKWERHRRVLREMGWGEDKINEFLHKAKANILAHDLNQKPGA